MCTVLLRLDPDGPWPMQLAAVRDEFVDRAWDLPAEHWPAQAPGVVGGRDATAGGTWLAVRADAVAALLNGARLAPPADGIRPSRGGLPLAVLTGTARLTAADLAGYDGFHLLLATRTGATVWTWDGHEVRRQELGPGDHIIVNDGVDATDDPLVPHFQPLLASIPRPDPAGERLWQPWQELLRGDGLPDDDPRALLVRLRIAERTYGSTSASLVALPAAGGARFAFTATPADPSWYEVPVLLQQ